jgi:transposase
LLELADHDGSMPKGAKETVKLLASHLEGLDRSIDATEERIAEANAESRVSLLLDQIPGIGPLIASAIAASVPNPSVFKSGRDFAAWLGLTPRQQSSGGKEKLGAITKQGNQYLRKMLVVGCTSALRVAARRKGVLADWIAALRARKPERLVAVALANKLARIGWAIMTTGEVFRQEIFAKA